MRGPTERADYHRGQSWNPRVRNGITAQHLFDYAEIDNNYGEPGYNNASRSNWCDGIIFLNVQLAGLSGQVLDVDKLPAKPTRCKRRVAAPANPKAKAKLRGDCRHRSLYCCGGDRLSSARTISTVGIPILVWRNLQDDQAIIHW